MNGCGPGCESWRLNARLTTRQVRYAGRHTLTLLSTEDARQTPRLIFASRYRSLSFPRSQKSRDLGTRHAESRFLTAKAVRNDKKEKVLGCGTAEAVPSRPLRTRTLAAASQE